MVTWWNNIDWQRTGAAVVKWWGNIDWAATGAWMQAWAGFAGVIAVIYAAKTGAATFQSWLKQRQTERRIHTAERALDVAYRLKRAFDAIRSPGYMGSAGPSAEQQLQANYPGFADLGEDQRGRLIWAQVILTRIHSFQRDWDALFECLPLAKAHFGDGVEAALNQLWQQQAIVNSATMSYGQPNIAPEFRASMEDRMWDGAGANAVGTAVAAAVTQLEQILLPVLRSEVAAVGAQE
jgi:hypothetical protein